MRKYNHNKNKINRNTTMKHSPNISPLPPHFRLYLLVVGFFLLGLFLMQFASCAPYRVMEKEIHTHHRDTLRLIDHRRDSLFQRDSIYLVERWVGDTLIREKTREIVRHHHRTKTDTIYRIVEKRVAERQVAERKKPWWARLKSSLGQVLLILLLCLLALHLIARKG